MVSKLYEMNDLGGSCLCDMKRIVEMEIAKKKRNPTKKSTKNNSLFPTWSADVHGKERYRVGRAIVEEQKKRGDCDGDGKQSIPWLTCDDLDDQVRQRLLEIYSKDVELMLQIKYKKAADEKEKKQNTR